MNDMSWHVELGPSRSQSSCPLWSSCQNPQWTCCARVKLDWRHWTFSALSPNASGCSTESFIFSMAPVTPIRSLDAQSDLLLRFHWRCWVEGAGNHNDRCPRAESKTVFIMYCTSAITLSFFGWAACWEISVRHHPDTFFSKAWFSLSCVRARGRLLRCMRPQIKHGYESMKCNWHEFYTTAPQLCEFDASAACLQPLFQHSSPLLGGVLTAKHVLTINCRTWPYRHPVSIPGHSCLTLWKIHENPQQEKQMQNPPKIWSFRKSDWFWG